MDILQDAMFIGQFYAVNAQAAFMFVIKVVSRTINIDAIFWCLIGLVMMSYKSCKFEL